MKRILFLLSVTLILFGCGTSPEKEAIYAENAKILTYQSDLDIHITELSFILVELNDYTKESVSEITEEDWEKELPLILDRLEVLLDEVEAMDAPVDLTTAHESALEAVADFRFVVEEYPQSLQEEAEKPMMEIKSKMDSGVFHFNDATMFILSYLNDGKSDIDEENEGY